MNNVVVLEVHYECAVFPAGYWWIANRVAFADGLSPAGLYRRLLHAAGRAVSRLGGNPIYNERVSPSGARGYSGGE